MESISNMTVFSPEVVELFNVYNLTFLNDGIKSELWSKVGHDGLEFNQTLQYLNANFQSGRGQKSLEHVMSRLGGPENRQQSVLMLVAVAAPAIQLALAVAAVICNVVVLSTFCRMSDKLTNHFILVISLCVSDMIIGLGHFSERFLVNWPACVMISNTSFYIGMFVCSLLNIILMAVDHYMALHYHLRYHVLMTRCRAVVALIAVWVISVIVGTLRMTAALTTSLQTDVTFCEAMIRDDTSLSMWASYSFVYIVAGLGVIVMLFTYIHIYKVGAKLTRRTSMYGPDVTDTRAKYRTTMTTLWITGTFVILWFPTLVFNVTLYLDQDASDEVIFIYDIMACLPLLNSVCDPVIYAIRLRKIREKLTSKCRRSQPSTHNYTTEMLTIS